MIAGTVRVAVDIFGGAFRRDGKFLDATKWFVSTASIAKV